MRGAVRHAQRSAGARLMRIVVVGDRDRGDVPGWVMVTVMSSILVVAILGVFEPQIKAAITNAMTSVTNSGTP